jgi:hypothetical protein
MVAMPGGLVMAEMDISIKVDGQSMNALLKKLAEMPDRLERKIARTVVGKTVTAYNKILRKHTPRSHRTGTYKGWSKRTAMNRIKDSLKKSITRKPSSQWKGASRYRRAGVIGITGGYAYRNHKVIAPHAHLVNAGKRNYLWSNEFSGSRSPRTDFLERAYDEGTSRATAVFKRELTKALREAVKV